MAEHAAGVAAEFAEGEGGFAAEVFGNVEAAAHGEGGAAAGGFYAFDPKDGAGADVDGAPPGEGVAVEVGLELGAAEGEGGVDVEAEGRAGERDFERGGVGWVAHEFVGDAVGIVVHRAGGRHADRPVADAAGVVLHAGLGAGFDHVDGGRTVGEGGEPLGVDLAGGEVGAGGDLAQVFEIALDAGDAGGGEGGGELGESLGTGGGGDDDLGDHRVVEGRDLGAALDPGLDPGEVGGREIGGGEHAAGGLEVFVRILGVEADLDGGSANVRITNIRLVVGEV